MTEQTENGSKRLDLTPCKNAENGGIKLSLTEESGCTRQYSFKYDSALVNSNEFSYVLYFGQEQSTEHL